MLVGTYGMSIRVPKDSLWHHTTIGEVIALTLP